MENKLKEWFKKQEHKFYIFDFSKQERKLFDALIENAYLIGIRDGMEEIKNVYKK